MFIKKLQTQMQPLKRGKFIREEEGSISIEAMIIMPMMFWTFLSLFSIFDAFHSYSINQKAAYTIGDAVSRETQPLDNDYIDGMWGLFNYLAQTDADGAMRITSVVYDAGQDRFEVDWSQIRGSAAVLSTSELTSSAASVTAWKARLPIIPDGERVMLVETWDTYDAPFSTGLEQQVIHNRIYTRPRYAPRVCWLACN
jgi:hypothetical protein